MGFLIPVVVFLIGCPFLGSNEPWRLLTAVAIVLNVASQANQLGVRVLRNVPIRGVDRNIDRDGPAHGLDPVNELEKFFVSVMAILVGHGRIERQIDGQEAVPLHITMNWESGK